MKVLFEARWVTHDHPSGRRWLSEMIPAMHRVRPEWSLGLGVPQAAPVEPWMAAATLVRMPRGVDRGPLAATWLTSVQNHWSFDVAVTQYFGPLLRPKAPVLCAVHDVLWLDHPEWFGLSDRMLLRAVKPSLRHVERLVTVSRSAARQLERNSVSERPIDVVHNGVARVEEALPSVEQREGLLYVGRADRRKNVDVAVAAWRAAGSSAPLTLVGASREQFETLLQDRLTDVRVAGVVTDEALRNLYLGGRALLFPSLGEGFGLPPLEAMAHGMAVLASDIPPHRELFEPAAWLLDPTDVDAWVRAIDRIITDDSHAQEMIAAGLALASEMSWDAGAERLAESVEGVASS